jgi:hypothetical protein
MVCDLFSRTLRRRRIETPASPASGPVRITASHTLAGALFLLGLAFSCSSAEAADITVPTDYPRIQDAINAAQMLDRVFVEPGTYQETITLKDGVDVIGIETARTFLTGGGGGTIMSAGSIVACTVRNFTFINASVGIQVSGNTSQFKVMNNVFALGAAGTALAVQTSPSVSIINNTFYSNGTAISRDADTEIVNNIFVNNQTVAISGFSSAAANIRFNDFYKNVATGPTGTNSLSSDPLFVDTANHDFHIRQGSPCIEAGDSTVAPDGIGNSFRSSLGAYGGPLMDTIPFPVTGLSIVSTTDTSISLTWLPNLSSAVTSTLNAGGYFVYYGYTHGTTLGDYNGTDGTEVSPVQVDQNTSWILNLDPSSRTPGAPVLDHPVTGDSRLTLTWSAVAGTTGYKVHYGIFVTGENDPIDVGNVTTYTLTGLKNGQTYLTAVSSYATATYYVVVTDKDFAGTESAPSQEVSTQVGSALESGLSNEQSEYPDTASPFPALPNKHNGCFIATAAFDSPVAPPVMALRSFRDQYLLNNGPGRLFVRLYYRYSPALASLLNEHPIYKPAVRVALMPVVAAAIFLTETPAMVRAWVVLFIASAAIVWFSRRRMWSRKGPH